MVAEAERFKNEDDQVRQKVEAKNALQSYAYNVKSSLSDVTLSEKFESEDKAMIEQKVGEVIQWLEGNPDAQTEALEGKKQELESVVNSIMTKVYQSSAPKEGFAEQGPDGPTVEATD